MGRVCRCRSERSAGHLPLSEGALLRWVGFTEEMVPVAIGDLARSRRSHFFSVLPLCFLECCMCVCVLMWSSSSKKPVDSYGFIMVKSCVYSYNGAVPLCFCVKSAFLDLT